MKPYEYVGNLVEYGTAEIDLASAERLRLLAINSGNVKEKGFFIGETATQITTAVRARADISDASGDYGVPEIQFYSKTRYFSEPDIWNSILYVTKFRDKNRDVKVDTRFETEVVGGEVVFAKRQVFIRRDIMGRITVDEDGPRYHRHSRQYKTFEKPTTVEDIDDIEERVGRVIKRTGI